MRNYGEACQGYDRVVSEDPSLTVYCPDKYITQRISDEAVDVSLAESKLIPHWFIASKMLEKLYTALFTDENTFYFNKNSANVAFCYDEMGILSVSLNNINLDNNFDEDDPDAIILIRLLAWHIRFEKRKVLEKKISEELISIAWHPKRWCNFCMPEDVKKKKYNRFLLSDSFNLYNLKVLEHFAT